MSGAIFFFSGTEAPKPPQHEKIRLMTLQPLDFKHEQAKLDIRFFLHLIHFSASVFFQDLE